MHFYLWLIEKMEQKTAYFKKTKTIRAIRETIKFMLSIFFQFIQQISDDSKFLAHSWFWKL